MEWRSWRKPNVFSGYVSLFLFVLAGLFIHPVFAQNGWLGTELVGLQQVAIQEKSAPVRERSFPVFTLDPNLSLDTRLLGKVYRWDSPLATGWMAGADRIAYPAFIGTPLAMWALHASGAGVSKQEARSMTGAWLIATGGAFVLKHLVRRARPYANLTDIEPKLDYVGARGLNPDASMPSGHAALGFALATTASLHYPDWYVTAPSFLVASSISLSRMWLGVHYPSDVLAGAALGVSAAILVHLIIE